MVFWVFHLKFIYFLCIFQWKSFQLSTPFGKYYCLRWIFFCCSFSVYSITPTSCSDEVSNHFSFVGFNKFFDTVFSHLLLHFMWCYAAKQSLSLLYLWMGCFHFVFLCHSINMWIKIAEKFFDNFLFVRVFCLFQQTSTLPSYNLEKLMVFTLEILSSNTFFVLLSGILIDRFCLKVYRLLDGK